jgi:CHAD domain-containing protein
MQALGAADEGSEANGVSDKVRLLTSGASLRTVLETQSRRRTYLLQHDGKAVASLSLDQIQVCAPSGERHTLARLTVDNIGATANSGLDRVIDALADACRLSPADGGEFASALRVAGIVPEAGLDFGSADLYADATSGEYAYASLRLWFAEFLTREPGTRLGEDPEQLHDMRVAARRMRSLIGVFGPVLPLRFDSLREDLRWIGAELGAVRDLDVRLIWLERVRSESDWRGDVAIGPLVEDVETSRREAREQLLASLSGDRDREFVSAMAAALRRGEAVGPDAATPVLEFAAATMRRRYRAYRRLAKGLTPDSPVEAYHAVRIAGKRLRYSVECFEPVLPKQGRRLIDATKRAQDELGEHQDCAVTIRWLTERAESRGSSLPPATLLRMGELLAQQRARMAEIRDQWPETLTEVRAGWRALRRALEPDRKRDRKPAEAGPMAVKPVQRPLWLFRRFLPGRRKDDR